jgi:hypothetical protein
VSASGAISTLTGSMRTFFFDVGSSWEVDNLSRGGRKAALLVVPAGAPGAAGALLGMYSMVSSLIGTCAGTPGVGSGCGTRFGSGGLGFSNGPSLERERSKSSSGPVVVVMVSSE